MSFISFHFKGKEVKKSHTGRRLAVEVSITGDHGIRKTQVQ